MVTQAHLSRAPRGWSINLGLNGVSAAAYGGWEGTLAACEFDANDMAAIAVSIGIEPTVLLTKKATRANLLSGMRAAAKALIAGDFFLLTYSGHGGQVPATNADEPDGQDETWCLYNGQFIDDELYVELARFVAGVRVLVLSDSCHSGSVTREVEPPAPPPGQRVKLMPDAVARRVYGLHQAFYDKLQAQATAAAHKARAGRVGAGALGIHPAPAPVAAAARVGAAAKATALVGEFNPAVVLISGCQDNQTSIDGQHNGAFTEQLLKVWRRGAFNGDYHAFHARICAALPATQSPNLFVLGNAAEFLKQRPFSI